MANDEIQRSVTVRRLPWLRRLQRALERQAFAEQLIIETDRPESVSGQEPRLSVPHVSGKALKKRPAHRFHLAGELRAEERRTTISTVTGSKEEDTSQSSDQSSTGERATDVDAVGPDRDRSGRVVKAEQIDAKVVDGPPDKPPSLHEPGENARPVADEARKALGPSASGDHAVDRQPPSSPQGDRKSERPPGSIRKPLSAFVREIAEKGAKADQSADSRVDRVLPAFRFLASSLSMASSRRGSDPDTARLAKLREAFTPTRPKHASDLFAGRKTELVQIVTAIETWNAHVVIFGERGYGKTSLANVVEEIARVGGVTVLNCTCGSSVTFEEVFRGFLKSLPMPYRGLTQARRETTHGSNETLADLLPNGRFGPAEVLDAVRGLTDMHVILRIDEFDRAQRDDLREKLAELIKGLSDLAAPVTMLIVGVANDLDELLGRHPSIQRNIVGVHVPLMGERDLRQLIEAGEKMTGIRFAEDVIRSIIFLSRGLPHQCHLLCLHGGQIALADGRSDVTARDLLEALRRVVELTPEALAGGYQRAAKETDGSMFRRLLMAAAVSAHDEFGNFTAADVSETMELLEGRPIRVQSVHRFLTALAGQRADGILVKTRLPTGIVYRFRHANMAQYIMAAEAVNDGLRTDVKRRRN